MEKSYKRDDKTRQDNKQERVLYLAKSKQGYKENEKNGKNAERITGLPGKTRTAKVIRTASKSEIKRWISRKIEDNL